MKKTTKTTIFIVWLCGIVVWGFPTTALAQCDCTEYIYLNEVTNGGLVHKFQVNSDGSLLEIGAPWYNNIAVGEELNAPHGLGIDLNGFFYIGEGPNNGDIRKLSCDGTIFPESDFAVPNGGQLNIVSHDHFVFTNAWAGLNGDNGRVIRQWDVCNTSTPVGNVTFCENDFEPESDWGLYYDDRTDIFYATAGFYMDAGETNYFWTFSVTDFDTDPSTCVTATPLSSNFPTIRADVRGVTTDLAGNVYIIIQNDSNLPNEPSYLLKFGPAPNFNFIARSAFDIDASDNVGFREAIGIVYSETADRLYVSTESTTDDCVSLFDTDLNYLATAVPAPGGESFGKGISITKECCPTQPN
ncbi:MAG: hypothetical protein AAGJ82_04285 [Bacteroidota bacterium]